MKEAVIVAYGRSPIGRAPKGAFKHTRPEDIAAQVVQGILNKVPQVDPAIIEDVIFGCAFPEAEQGMNVAKIIAQRVGMPDVVSGQTVNRFCSSGLQTIATAANAIMAGQAEVILAGGVESMSAVPMGGNIITPNPYLMEHYPEAYIAMGLTAENVADKYNVTRQMMDEFSSESHARSLKAQQESKFTEEIIPIEAVKPVTLSSGAVETTSVIVAEDEGIRPGTTPESLGKLKPVFKAGGSVTAGNSSQMSDGAAAVLVMSCEKAKELGLTPIAKFKSFAVAGVPAELMGIGPVAAIPKALKIAGLEQDDIDLIELNEAFAAQSIACINELGLNPDIINVNGGAISLGHPLGCSGAFLTCKLLSEMKRRNSKYGLVSMCIGGGMGAAGIFEIV